MLTARAGLARVNRLRRSRGAQPLRRAMLDRGDIALGNMAFGNMVSGAAIALWLLQNVGSTFAVAAYRRGLPQPKSPPAGQGARVRRRARRGPRPSSPKHSTGAVAGPRWGAPDERRWPAEGRLRPVWWFIPCLSG